MKYIYKPILLTVAFICIACTEQEIKTYGDINYVGFEQLPSGEQIFPEASYNFIYAGDSVTHKPFEVPVWATGKFTDGNQTFAVQVVDSLTTAVEGKHFNIDPAKQFVPGNEVSGVAIVDLIRDESLKDSTQTYYIGIALVDNDQFLVGENPVFIVKVSDYVSKPDWWYTNWDYYWSASPNSFIHIGYYTKTKFLLWMEFWGVTDGSDPWIADEYFHWWVGENDGVPFYKPACRYTISAFILWLENKEAEQESPVLDEYGNRVIDTLDQVDN